MHIYCIVIFKRFFYKLIRLTVTVGVRSSCLRGRAQTYYYRDRSRWGNYRLTQTCATRYSEANGTK